MVFVAFFPEKQTLGYQDGWQPSARCHFCYCQRNLEAMARYFGGQLRNKNTIHRSCLPTVHRSIGLTCRVIFCKALCSYWQQFRRTRPEQNLGWGMLPCKIIYLSKTRNCKDPFTQNRDNQIALTKDAGQKIGQRRIPLHQSTSWRVCRSCFASV